MRLVHPFAYSFTESVFAGKRIRTVNRNLYSAQILDNVACQNAFSNKILFTRE